MPWLRSWEAFVRVVEEGSMAAAARRLDVTRAQVSHQIAELEHSFGLRLLERSTRRLRLTPAGEVFHRHALAALAAVEQARVAVKNTGETARGVLRISASITFGRLHVAPLLPRLLQRYPELECELVLTDERVNLDEDDIDVALRLTSSPPQDAVARRLAPMRRVICASPAYARAHGLPRTPDELSAHPCFNYLGGHAPGQWQLLDAAGQEVRVEVQSRLQFNNIDCVLDAVRAGLGLAILPAYLCGADLAQGRLLSVLADFEPLTRFGRELYACYPPSRARAPKVRAFLAELEALFDPVPPWERVDQAASRT